MSVISRIYHFISSFGIDPKRFWNSLRDIPGYLRDYWRFRRLSRGSVPLFSQILLRPCWGDRKAGSGVASGHYFHQDLLVARRIFANNPRRHVDVGSRVDGFVAHVASFRELYLLDVRPLSPSVSGVHFRQADLMQPLDPSLAGFCDSLSSLHALEHFGLGRYGDPIHPEGHRIGLRNMGQILQPGGMFYLSVPMGPSRIEFNAHRVFGLKDLLALVRPEFHLERFSFVDDEGHLHENTRWDDRDVVNSFNCWYGLAILELKKG